jgi:hypothetical protein
MNEKRCGVEADNTKSFRQSQEFHPLTGKRPKVRAKIIRE